MAPDLLNQTNGRKYVKKQYICPGMWKKTHFTSLENFIKKDIPIIHRVICEKSLEYESIEYLSYQKRSEFIELEKME